MKILQRIINKIHDPCGISHGFHRTRELRNYTLMKNNFCNQTIVHYLLDIIFSI